MTEINDTNPTEPLSFPEPLFFPPFEYDFRKKLLLRDGSPVTFNIELIPLQGLDFVLRHHDRLVTYDELIEELWKNDASGKSDNDLQRRVRPLFDRITHNGHEFIQNVRKLGYRFIPLPLPGQSGAEVGRSSVGLVVPLPHNSSKQEPTCPPSRVRQMTAPLADTRILTVPGIGHVSDINAFLSRQQLTLNHIDNYVELESDDIGWKQDEVEFRRIGKYDPPDYMIRLMAKYPAQEPIRGYYSLCDVESRTKDEEHKLIIYAQDGDWRHIYALNELAINHGPESQQYRDQCEADFMPGENSRLYHQLCCYALVVSADGRIVLCRRRQNTRSGFKVPFYPGAWAASLEENMLRHDPSGRTQPDPDLFVCMERGIYEELQVHVQPQNMRLLSYGVEWHNFAAAFLFVAKANVDYQTIAKSWCSARDKVEAIAIDNLPAEADVITDAISKVEWQPSAAAKTWKRKDSISRDVWHGISRARLHCYLRHLREEDWC